MKRIAGGLLSAMLIVLSVQQASATLVITDAQIVGNHYTYDLTFGETANNAVLNADALSVTRLTCCVDTWNPTELHEIIAYKTNSTSAGVLYKFDFSQTTYRPTALSLREKFNLFNNIHGHDLTLAWSGWSTDATTWTTITSFTTPQNTPHGGGTVTNYQTVIPGMPEVVYYQMSMTTQTGDADGVLTEDHNQWNRISATSTDYFLADFTMAEVPEPLTLLGLTLGVGAVALRLRHRLGA